MTKALDLTDKSFGRLIAKHRLPSTKTDSVWECVCSCGNITQVYTHNLTRGYVKSCGCLGKEHWVGYQEISGTYWSKIKQGANKRNLEFSISIEYAWDKFIEQDRKCVLTGQLLQFGNYGCKNKIEQTASLDRIDSSKGYIYGNIQWVHKIINKFKQNFSADELIKLCKQVLRYNIELKANRPDWTEYFLGLAVVVSRRSRDPNTKHGCVIVDGKTNHVIATGYNSFPRGMQDDTLPTNRPDKNHPELDNKYNWMLHSEFNACCNLTDKVDEHTICYVTGECCFNCLTCLWQHGITRIVHRDALGSKYLIDEETRKRRDILLAQTGMKIEVVKTDLDWLKAACLTL